MELELTLKFTLFFIRIALIQYEILDLHYFM